MNDSCPSCGVNVKHRKNTEQINRLIVLKEYELISDEYFEKKINEIEW